MKRAWVAAVAAMVCLGSVSATRQASEGAPPWGAVMGEPVVISRGQWGSRPQTMPTTMRHVPRVLTVHHAGVLWRSGMEPYQVLRNLQSWGQRDKKWPDVPYHYLISPDGRIFEGRDVNYRPESNTKYDLDGVLNVHLWGHFDEQRVSVEQLRSTVSLLAKLCRELKLDPKLIRGHRDAAPGQTTCPGKDVHRYLEGGQLRRWVEETLAGKVPAIEELPEAPGGPTTRITTTAPASRPAR